jgi:hypothetical protein
MKSMRLTFSYPETKRGEEQHADPDIPILKQAKVEYAKMQ